MSVEKRYYPSVDFMRAIAALIIALYHFYFYGDARGELFSKDTAISSFASYLPGAVYIFFLISGFVITMTMTKYNYSLKRVFRFLARRMVRIELPYIGSIFVYFLVAFLWTVVAGSDFTMDLTRLAHHIFYTTAFFGYEWYNEIYWTLAIEFQFYIFIALAFPLFVHKKLWLRYTSLTVFSLFAFVFPNNLFVFHYAPTFVAGILMFLWLNGNKENKLDLFFISLALLQVGFILGWVYACYLLISLVVFSKDFSMRNLFVRFGQQAYSFYLLHGVFGGTLIYFVFPWVENTFSKILLMIGATLFSIVLSYLFYKYFELPTHQLSRKIKYSAKKREP